MRSMRAAVLARSAQARAELPEGPVPLSGWPLLVVLHEPGGARRSLPPAGWARAARESGAALLCVSNPRGVSPAWVEDRRHFVERPWSYQEAILEAVQRASEESAIDALRIVIAGEGSAALPAFDLALRASGIFRGVIVLDGPIDTALARENAETASAAGLRVFVWRQAGRGDDAAIADRFRRWFDRFGFGARGSFEWIAPGADALGAAVQRALKALSNPER